MPTYEYECRKCGHRFDVFQRIVDPPVKNCPRCKKRSCVEQIISGGSGLIFKGSGFYITDYKKNSSPPDDGKGKPPAEGKSSADTQNKN